MNKEKSFLCAITPKTDTDNNIELLLELLHKSGLYKYFEVCQTTPSLIPQTFNQEFLDYIIKYGFSSLFNYSSLNEDIISPSFEYDEIENVIIKFSSQLNHSKIIVITDPYIYSIKEDDLVLLNRIIKSFCSNLEKIIFITKPDSRYQVSKTKIHNIINQINSNIQIIDYHSNDFHDRFWIGLDTNIGIVMGTSLNGVSKKIALIDRLSSNNVDDIIKELNRLNFV